MKIHTSMAFNKFGVQLCKLAHDVNVRNGLGVETLAFNFGLTAHQAENAINAWAAVLADFHVGDEVHALGEQWVLELRGSRHTIRRLTVKTEGPAQRGSLAHTDRHLFAIAKALNSRD